MDKKKVIYRITIYGILFTIGYTAFKETDYLIFITIPIFIIGMDYLINSIFKKETSNKGC